jgi:hypothetical protein
MDVHRRNGPMWTDKRSTSRQPSTDQAFWMIPLIEAATDAVGVCQVCRQT